MMTAIWRCSPRCRISPQPGHPVLVGPSSKSFIGRLTGAEVDDRLPGTLAALMPAVGIDRAVVRVHDAAAAVQFLEIASRLHEASA